MTNRDRILFTGGSGLLGTELKPLFPESMFPTSAEFDVTDRDQITAYAEAHPFELLVHAAAFTSPPKIDADPTRAIDANIIGTANIVKLCLAVGARLIYLSTDYVFRGDEGNYSEEDALHPVNRYAWSKLGGECAVRMLEDSLIVRTTFGPNEFPYPKAFVDQWTSRESVSAIARKVAALIGLSEAKGVVHVGGERRSVFAFAKSLDESKEIGELSIHDVGFSVPADTSLSCERYERLIDRGERDS
ncbi:MAG: NAD-dependent epimerase/dehydratase family protein [Planctomycetota bacterium]|nr:MAG: NAD-dependent epimerase/dehydratase family protein [Planctomycetota bacterium]